MKQKNLENRSLDMNTHIGVMPKKIFKTWEQRRIKNKLVKVKKIQNVQDVVNLFYHHLVVLFVGIA